MGRLIVDDMTWGELREHIKNVKIAVVPVGSCEQHSFNTTFATDTVRAYEFCKLLADRVGEDILVYPPITYGLSFHHMGFEGTATLRVKTMIDLLTDIAISINKHGIERILFVNGHGGNRVALDATILELKQQYGIKAYWTAMGTNLVRKKLEDEYGIPKVIGHACEVETSSTMHLAPWAVREEKVAGELKEDSPYFRKVFVDGNSVWDWRGDVSANGSLGDARKSCIEMGELITETALNYVDGLIKEILDMN